MTNKLYFSRKQYFRDTTAPAGLSEVINVRQAIPVQPKQKIFPEPVLLNQRSDYFGNDLFTYRDIQGNIKTISIMKGANKPRGINANVKWSMSPNKFKRGRGLNSRDGFIKPMGRRGETTEFFKSRYQSAYGEMLIQQKIKDADKLSKKKTKVLKEELKKKEDKIKALVSSNAQTIQNLKDENKKDMDTLKLQLGVMYSGGMSGGGFQGGKKPTGVSSDDVGDTGTDPIVSNKGKGGGKGKKPPPPPPTQPRPPTQQEIDAFQKAEALGGSKEGILSQIKALADANVSGGLLTPSQLKGFKSKKQKKEELKADGDPPITLGSALASALGETPIKPAEEPADIPADEPSVEFTDQPLEEGFLEKTITAPELTSKQKQQEAVVDILETSFKENPEGDTPRPEPPKTKFSSFIEGIGEIKAPKKPSKKFLKSLETQIEAEEKLKKGAEELGETLTANIGGEKQTSTPAPKIPPPQPTPPTIPSTETPPKIPPLSEAKPEKSTSEFTMADFKEQLSEAQKPLSLDKPTETPPIPPPLSEAKPEFKEDITGLSFMLAGGSDPSVSVNEIFKPSIEKAIKETLTTSDSKGDYFDNLKVMNSKMTPKLTEGQIIQLVNIYPRKPAFIQKEDEPSVEPTPAPAPAISSSKKGMDEDTREAMSYFAKNQFATSYTTKSGVRFSKGESGGIFALGGGGVSSTPSKSEVEKRQKEAEKLLAEQKRKEQMRKESIERQLKVLEDKYAGINFKKGSKNILENMFKQINSQNLSADLLEPTINRAVQDLNSHLQLRGKNRVGKKTIENVKGKVFGLD